MSDSPLPEILPHGADGILLRLGLSARESTVAAVQILRAAMEDACPHGVEEIASSLTSVYLRFDPARTTRAEVCATAQSIARGVDLSATTLPAPRHRWTIPVVLGGEHGPHFDEMVRATGHSDQRAREVLLSARLRVLAIGFAPGLPYMGLLPEAWDVPRLRDVTPKVPACALVAAVRQLIIFTNPTPTGWRHIGQTAFHGFQVGRDPATALSAGDEIRLEQMTPADLHGLQTDNPDGLGGARCEVLS
ncbi:MAG: allophanate hydrolase [Pseudooceanicola sp.]|nr:allophanate hydrolase [Pseudooceanicola sp.]